MQRFTLFSIMFPNGTFHRICKHILWWVWCCSFANRRLSHAKFMAIFVCGTSLGGVMFVIKIYLLTGSVAIETSNKRLVLWYLYCVLMFLNIQIFWKLKADNTTHRNSFALIIERHRIRYNWNQLFQVNYQIWQAKMVIDIIDILISW